MTLRGVFAGIFSSYVFLSCAAIASGESADASSVSETVPTPVTQGLQTLNLALIRQSETVPTAVPSMDSATSVPSVVATTVAPYVRPDVLSDSAVAYGMFQSDVTSFKQTLESTSDIDNAMTTLGTHNHQKLASGWLSYSALLAAQSDAFRKGVQDTADFHGRDRLLEGMRNSPAYTLSLKGADDAMRRALGATKADARRLDRIGENIKEQAYSLQQLGWAKAKLKGQPSEHANKLRLAALNGRPQSSEMRSLFAGSQLDEALSGATGLGGASSFWDRLAPTTTGLRLPTLSPLQSPTFSNAYAVRTQRRQTAGNIATLAALKILGETATETPYVTAALQDGQTQSCFEEAQMNLLQCVSASRNVYERPFCIGVHALKEVGTCLSDVTY